VKMTEPGMRAGPHPRMRYPGRFLLQSSSRGGAEPRRTRVFGPSAIGGGHAPTQQSVDPSTLWLRGSVRKCPGPR
jgi:hypothetical protein